MIVKVQHAELVLALRRLESLADHIEAQSHRAEQGTPVGLPSLSVLPTKARWMRDQAPDLEQLAALALLLDTEGSGSVTFETPGSDWGRPDDVRQRRGAALRSRLPGVHRPVRRAVP